MIKKLLSVFLLFIITITLSSCQVNWFDQHYDVPWWVITLPVVIFCAIVWIFAGKHIASKKYICPKCNKTFYPKWWKAAISIHMNSERVFKCPHCGRKGFCHISGKKED